MSSQGRPLRGLVLVSNAGIFGKLPGILTKIKRQLCCLNYGVVAVTLYLAFPSARAQETLIIDVNVFGLTVNQSSTLTQLDVACATVQGGTSVEEISLLALCNEIDQIDPDTAVGTAELQRIADVIGVEEAFAISDSLVLLSDFQTTNVRARLDALRQSSGSGATQSFAGQQFPGLPSGGAASSDLPKALGGFINGHVSSGDMDGGILQQDSDISSSSLTFGADYRFNDNVIAGLGMGVLQDENTFKSVSGSAASDGINVTAFASWYETDEGYLDVVLDIGQTDYELRRSVSFEPTVPLSTSSSLGSNSTTVTVSGGRNFRPFEWDLGGYFRFSHARATVDAFTETLSDNQTGDSAPLFTVGEQTVQSTRIVLGFELSKAFSTPRAVLVPLIRLEYVTENERNKDDIEATLLVSGTPFRYQGEPREERYSNLGVGLSAVFAQGRSAFLFYETHLQHETISQEWIKTGLRMEF